MKATHIMIPEDLREEVDFLREQRRKQGSPVSFGAIVREALVEFLTNHATLRRQ